MPAKNPRINVLLNEQVYNEVRFLAKKDGVSISNKASDLIKEALEIEEDLILADLASTREETLDDASTLTHDDVWS
jgi:transcriptional antiterminator Rof (Rho-off)